MSKKSYLILSLILSLLIFTACNGQRAESNSEVKPEDNESAVEESATAENTASKDQEEQAPPAEENAAAKKSAELELSFVNLGKIRGEEAYLVYILESSTEEDGAAGKKSEAEPENQRANSPDTPAESLSYRGLAIFNPLEEAAVDYAKVYRATSDGIMTRSIPPHLSGELIEVLEKAPEPLDLNFDDLIIIRSLLNQEVQLVDVRTEPEFKTGHLKGAELLPLQAIQAGERGELKKDAPLFLYCRSGNRSGQAMEILKEEGYEIIANLGGVIDYHGELVTD